MKLSSGWEQSIYVLLILARLPEGHVMTSFALADRLSVSPSYLKKTIKLLVNEGLLKSAPGKNGGFSLAKPLTDISFLDVFSAVEGRGRIFYSQRLLIKFLGLDADHGENCMISTTMNYLEENLMSTLAATKLSQIEQNNLQKHDLTNLDQWIAEND